MNYHDDSDPWKLENSMRWGVPLQDDHALGFQFMPPLKWRETATDSLLGDNAFILRPIAALRWDFNAITTRGINVEYNFTPMKHLLEKLADAAASRVALNDLGRHNAAARMFRSGTKGILSEGKTPCSYVFT